MAELSLISPFTNYYTNLIDEFFILGVQTINHAKKLLTNAFYRGEVLFSIPNQFAYFTDVKETLNAFKFQILDHNPGNHYFASSINEMQINVSYLHCFVVYNDISELINTAKLHTTEEFIDAYELPSEKQENFILNPTEIKKQQEKYYYPFNFVIKTKSTNHDFFRRILEEMAKILVENPFPKKNLNTILENELNLHNVRLLKFSANLFFLINNLIRVSTSTKTSYKLNNEVIECIQPSVLVHPYMEDPFLLSILELEVEAAIFLWKSLIIGLNVIVIAEENEKRFNIMEALSFLMFPFTPPIKISSFVMRLDIEANRLFLSASHFFIGYSSYFTTMEQLIADDYIAENFSLCDLDHSTFYPQKKPQLDLGNWEKELKQKLKIVKESYLRKLRNIKNTPDFSQEIDKIKKETCRVISKAFFEFFEKETILCQIENFLNLKKVEILSDPRSIIKQPGKLIELIKKPKEFVKSMIEEYTFNTFAREMVSIDLNPSYRFKNIIAAISHEKKKMKLLIPYLHQSFEINQQSQLFFVRKLIEKGSWEEEKFNTFEQIFKRAEEEKEINDQTLCFLAKIPTNIINVNPNKNNCSLIDFLLTLSQEFILFESEEMQDKAFEAVTSLNFNEIIKNDFKIDLDSRGQILNFEDFLPIQAHLALANKALYYSSFNNLTDKKDIREIYELFFNSYQEYLNFERNEMQSNTDLKEPIFDFPDFPRTDFSHFLTKKAKLHISSEDLKIFEELNPKSNVVSLLTKRIRPPLNTINSNGDIVANFPIICYNYLNFLKNFFRSNNALTKIVNVNGTQSKTEIGNLLKKLANEQKYNLKQIDDVFSKLSKDLTVHTKPYSDEEKLCFYLNFFNLKLLHEMLFNRLTNEMKTFPKTSKEWIEFLSSIDFGLFGMKLNLWEFDSIIIRQFLDINHLFIPVTSFFTNFTGLNEGELFKRKSIPLDFSFFKRKKQLSCENLINFAQFFCIRDTPIYVIFDDPKNVEEVLKDHTKEHFKFFKKMHNFNFLKDPRALKIPVPQEFLQSQSKEIVASNEIIRNFLKTYYDARIEEFKPNQISFEQKTVDLNLFYLNPAYFG